MAIGEIREQLSNVATGLSFAFDTTLLGLMASLITMLFTSFIQKMEEGFLTNVESLCLKIISNFKPDDTRIANDDPVNASIEPIQKELKEVVNAMHNISQNLAKILENSDTQLQALLQSNDHQAQTPINPKPPQFNEIDKTKQKK